jgi:hypothetical protein
MRRLVISIHLFLILSSVFCRNNDQSYLEKLDNYFQASSDILAEIIMTTFRQDKPVTSDLYRYFFSGREKSFILIPWGEDACRDIAYLHKGAEYWAYAIPAHTFFPVKPFERIKESAVFIEDFLFPSFSSEYTILSSGAAGISGVESPVLKLELKAKNTLARYPKLVVFADEQTCLLYRVDAYDVESNLLKTIKYSGWKRIQSSYFPSKILITGAANEDLCTLITFKAITPATIPDYIFTRSFIEYMAR